jgi:hypothetical protein
MLTASRGNVTQDVRALFASFVIGGTFASAGMGGYNAAIADLYADDPAAMATASSRLGLGPLLGGVVGPREQQIGGSGGSLAPPGLLLEAPRPLLTHLYTVYMACSECLLTRLNPLAERTCFSQVGPVVGSALAARDMRLPYAGPAAPGPYSPELAPQATPSSWRRGRERERHREQGGGGQRSSEQR